MFKTKNQQFQHTDEPESVKDIYLRVRLHSLVNITRAVTEFHAGINEEFERKLRILNQATTAPGQLSAG